MKNAWVFVRVAGLLKMVGIENVKWFTEWFWSWFSRDEVRIGAEMLRL